jgi:hypothetical protein
VALAGFVVALAGFAGASQFGLKFKIRAAGAPSFSARPEKRPVKPGFFSAERKVKKSAKTSCAVSGSLYSLAHVLCEIEVGSGDKRVTKKAKLFVDTRSQFGRLRQLLRATPAETTEKTVLTASAVRVN